MRANLAGSLPWALGVLALCVVMLGPARAAAQKRPQGSLQIELHAPDTCAGSSQFAQQLRARLSGQAEPRASVVVTITTQGAGVRGELHVQRAGRTTARRLEASSCAEALNALSLVAALILDATPDSGSETPPATARRGPRGGERAPASAAGVSAEPATSASAMSSEPGAGPQAAPATAAAAVMAEPSSTTQVAAPAPSPPAPAASSERASTRPSRADAAPAPSKHGSAHLVLDMSLSALLMTHVAPAIRPGAALGFGLGVRRDALLLAGEVDARAALPHSETTTEGSARFTLVAAGIRVCTEGLMAGRQLGLSGCASAELGTLAARGSHTDEPASSRSLWGALGPGLRLSWYSARRVGVRLGAELLFPLTRPSYTLGDVTVFSVGPVTFRLELALRVKLL